MAAKMVEDAKKEQKPDRCDYFMRNCQTIRFTRHLHEYIEKDYKKEATLNNNMFSEYFTISFIIKFFTWNREVAKYGSSEEDVKLSELRDRHFKNVTCYSDNGREKCKTLLSFSIHPNILHVWLRCLIPCVKSFGTRLLDSQQVFNALHAFCEYLYDRLRDSESVNGSLMDEDFEDMKAEFRRLKRETKDDRLKHISLETALLPIVIRRTLPESHVLYLGGKEYKEFYNISRDIFGKKDLGKCEEKVKKLIGKHQKRANKFFESKPDFSKANFLGNLPQTIVKLFKDIQLAPQQTIPPMVNTPEHEQQAPALLTLPVAPVAPVLPVSPVPSAEDEDRTAVQNLIITDTDSSMSFSNNDGSVYTATMVDNRNVYVDTSVSEWQQQQQQQQQLNSQGLYSQTDSIAELPDLTMLINSCTDSSIPVAATPITTIANSGVPLQTTSGVNIDGLIELCEPMNADPKQYTVNQADLSNYQEFVEISNCTGEVVHSNSGNTDYYNVQKSTFAQSTAVSSTPNGVNTETVKKIHRSDSTGSNSSVVFVDSQPSGSMTSTKNASTPKKVTFGDEKRSSPSKPSLFNIGKSSSKSDSSRSKGSGSSSSSSGNGSGGGNSSKH